MAAFNSIDYMVSDWGKAISRPRIARSGELYGDHRSQIIAGHDALRRVIGHEPDGQGGTYEVDTTVTDSLKWLKKGEIPAIDIVIASLVKLSRIYASDGMLNKLQAAFPTTEAINDPLAFDLNTNLLLEATDYNGLPALLRLPNGGYPQYNGQSVLLIAERLLGVPSREDEGQLVCLGSQEVNPSLATGSQYTVIPARMRFGQPYTVADNESLRYQEEYLQGAVLYPFQTSHE